jgi:hypothetical protein
MAAFVLVPPASVDGSTRTGGQLNVFPGSATPAVSAAGEPFWVGYGFVAEPGDTIEECTRFELRVDGRAVAMQSEVRREGGAAVHRLDVAEFPAGLPAGWHELSGRWYERGRLALSNRVAIEFVER